MEIMRLAICDDSTEIVEQIESYIDKMQEMHIEYEVFFSGEELYRYKKNEEVEFDIYLLDIEMKQMSGLELGHILRDESPYALIIYLTSHAQYVYDVFDVVTFDFIVKPLNYLRFQQAIEKATKYLHRAKVNFIFSYRKNTYSIPCQLIMYIEKRGRKAYIHTRDGKINKCNITINEIWKQLSTKMFVQIHASCIVNLEVISEIIKEQLVLEDGSVLYVGRNHKQEVKLKHLAFLKEQL